ncbi:uncharacterized protein N7518_002412 [Penicillium psychrosexuale]|uniref:uncharacterized protein n=1 Tax=Penicillium psychrosexuale TaxID=1002107 RepID=UPI0025459EE1|nr:uncharacterized protein N7518_002412 [Penicillium psychrosexuale]KAJ5800344.1 hypothetical protein N7518_002412 [Penicillium psychrosexuale]
MTVAKYDEDYLKHPSDKEHNMQPITTVSSGLQPASMTFEHMIAVDEQPKNVLSWAAGATIIWNHDTSELIG